MQSFGSQLWDTSLTIQALLVSDLTNEIGPILVKGHEFLKKSQVLFSIHKLSLHLKQVVYLFMLKSSFFRDFNSELLSVFPLKM